MRVVAFRSRKTHDYAVQIDLSLSDDLTTFKLHLLRQCYITSAQADDYCLALQILNHPDLYMPITSTQELKQYIMAAVVSQRQIFFQLEKPSQIYKL